MPGSASATTPPLRPWRECPIGVAASQARASTFLPCDPAPAWGGAGKGRAVSLVPGTTALARAGLRLEAGGRFAALPPPFPAVDGTVNGACAELQSPRSCSPRVRGPRASAAREKASPRGWFRKPEAFRSCCEEAAGLGLPGGSVSKHPRDPRSDHAGAAWLLGGPRGPRVALRLCVPSRRPSCP